MSIFSGLFRSRDKPTKKLIEKITVFTDHFTVEFKSGITIDIEA